MKKIIFILALAIVVSACKKDEDVIVPNQVACEYNLFLSEAKNEGVNINERKFKGFILTGKITSVICDNGDYAASYYSHQTEYIYIDTTTFDYMYNKETMIFHELGHAILRREHRTEKMPDGEISSIMDANSLPTYNFALNYLYKRQYYIDELFHQRNVPYPSWAN